MSAPNRNQLDALLIDVGAEVVRAAKKFPGRDHHMMALMEEVGELAKALMDESPAAVRTEAIQVAAMAMRVAIDGDPSVDALRQERGLASYPERFTPEDIAEVLRRRPEPEGMVVDRPGKVAAVLSTAELHVLLEAPGAIGPHGDEVKMTLTFEDGRKVAILARKLSLETRYPTAEPNTERRWGGW